MEEVFIVEMWGVFNQGNIGVFTTLDQALDFAKESIENETDNYHNYRVTKHILNQTNNEPSEYYEISRDQDGQIQTESFQEFKY